MKVDVQLFARARDLAGAPQVEVDIPDPARVADLKVALRERFPGLSPLLPNLLVAVDMEYANDQTALAETSQIACFPPVSGG
ncbi:MAG: MoaD/ThiS family protein [Planctomycetaceae bacterium]